MVDPLLALFPGLRASESRITSPATRDYNCIAWAVGDPARWWWPDAIPSNPAIYWPPGVPREETLAAFRAVFAALGFLPAEGQEWEEGFERVALYALADGTPTRAARRVGPDAWTSKLGALEDITHPLQALCGSEYGKVVRILRRPAPKF
jgi:hypothetical protein